MASNASIRYFITTIGAIITVISGLLLLLGIFVTGLSGLGSVVLFNPAGFAIIGGSLLLAIIPIIWILLALVIYNAGHSEKGRGKAENGVIIIVLSIIIFVLGGGFVIGPVLSGIGGVLLIL
jgi:hypothetical protein